MQREELQRQGGGANSAARKTRATRLKAFLRELSKHGTITRAAKVAGVSRNAVLARRKSDPKFARRVDEAIEQSTDELERSLIRSARVGEKKGIYYRGEWVADEYVKSTLAAIFILKARRPDIYCPEARIAANAAQSAAEFARELHEAATKMQGSVPKPPEVAP